MIKSIKSKCDNPNCGKELIRQKWHQDYFEKIYCNKECQRQGSIKYTAAVLEFVKENINKIRFDNLASRLSVSKSGLLKQLSEWRTKGEVIPIRKKENRNPPKIKIATPKPVVHKENNIGKQAKPIDKKPLNGASQNKLKEEKKMTIKDFTGSTYERRDSRTLVVKKQK